MKKKEEKVEEVEQPKREFTQEEKAEYAKQKEGEKESKALDAFANLVIEKIKTFEGNWQKPWITPNSLIPQNLDGRAYNSMNALMLMLLAEEKGWKSNVYVTSHKVFNLNIEKDKKGNLVQATDKNGKKLPKVFINKGEHSFPVILSLPSAVNKETKERIDIEEYKKLSEAEKDNYKIYYNNRVYNVFNITEQTNLKEARPELYNKIMKATEFPELKQGMYTFAPLDAMVDKNLWVCPIEPKAQGQAYYSPSEDKIVVPLKSQFKTGEGYYGTMLHEMTHSTGAKNRLNRIEDINKFGSNEYAREELVAELGAAFLSHKYGMVKTLKEDSVPYLKSWMSKLSNDPEFIKTTLFDVKHASAMINERVEEVRKRTKEQTVKVEEDGKKAQAAAIEDDKRKQREQKKAAEDKQKQEQAKKQEEQNKKGTGVNLKPYFALVAFAQAAYEISDGFDDLVEKGDEKAMLQVASDVDQGDAISQQETYARADGDRGDSILAENDNYVVVGNAMAGGTIEVYRKVDEQTVRESINRYGLESDASPDVKEVGKQMVAEEFAAIKKTPAFTMENDELVYFQYNKETDQVECGGVTNAGLNPDHKFDYDHSFTLDQNLEGIYEELSQLPEYQKEEEEEDESEDEEVHYGRGR